MSFQRALETFKAAADPTRLRLLCALADGEATVGELQSVLEQSQPRVSRHLRLLDQAGLLTRFRDGQSVYYRLAESAEAAQLVDLIRRLNGPADAVTGADQRVLQRVARDRQRTAFVPGAAQSLPGLPAAARPSHEQLVDALEEALDDFEPASALDIGCGAGALLVELGRRARIAVGVDTLRPMRLLSRARLQQAGLASCTVRGADMHALPFESDAFDLVVLDEVLGETDRPEAAVAEAARVLRAGGRLLILDRIAPAARQLTDGEGGPSLISNQLATTLAAAGLALTRRQWFPARAMEYAMFCARAQTARQETGTYA